MKSKSPIIIENDDSQTNFLYKVSKWISDSLKSFFQFGCGCLITIFIIIPAIFYLLDIINIIIDPLQILFNWFSF